MYFQINTLKTRNSVDAGIRTHYVRTFPWHYQRHESRLERSQCPEDADVVGSNPAGNEIFWLFIRSSGISTHVVIVTRLND